MTKTPTLDSCITFTNVYYTGICDFAYCCTHYAIRKVKMPLRSVRRSNAKAHLFVNYQINLAMLIYLFSLLNVNGNLNPKHNHPTACRLVGGSCVRVYCGECEVVLFLKICESRFIWSIVDKTRVAQRIY